MIAATVASCKRYIRPKAYALNGGYCRPNVGDCDCIGMNGVKPLAELRCLHHNI